MRSLFLAMLASLLISGLGLSHCWAVEQTQQTSNSLSKYLHQRRLPLVEARVIPSPGGTRTLPLYGFVATELGKQDAENQALDFLADPDIEITNLIKITPELMGLNSSNNGAALVSSDASTTDQSATDKSTAELGSLGDENAAASPAAISRPRGLREPGETRSRALDADAQFVAAAATPSSRHLSRSVIFMDLGNFCQPI
jgi:hypothetical protein